MRLISVQKVRREGAAEDVHVLVSPVQLRPLRGVLRWHTLRVQQDPLPLQAPGQRDGNAAHHIMESAWHM